MFADFNKARVLRGESVTVAQPVKVESVPEQKRLSEPNAFILEAAPKRAVTATGQFYFMLIVTISSFQDFIHMNASPKDILPNEFSPL